jgi:hypothetical protein
MAKSTFGTSGADVRTHLPRRAGAESERGFALMTTVIVTMVAAMLGATLLVISVNTDHHSGQDRNWTSALDVADAGVERAVALLNNQAGIGVVPAPFTGQTQSGTFSTKVTYLGRAKYQIDSTGTVGTAQGLERIRAVRVIMAPAPAFKYALFSSTDINTKNNNYITGDIWANGSVTVFKNDTVSGSVNAATGWVQLQTNSTVTGGVTSGGTNGGTSIEVDGGASIGKDATAASTSPNCADDPAHMSYQIQATGSISGTAKTWGLILGGGHVGTAVTGVCTPAPATQPMPNFTFALANYNPSPQVFNSVASFQTYLSMNQNNLSGVFQVCGTGVIDLSGAQIAADTTIIAGAVLNNDINQPDPNCPAAQIWANGVSPANNNDKILTIVSYYNPGAGGSCTNNGGNPEGCALGFKNNFAPNDNTATLMYAPVGPCALKNSSGGSGGDNFDGAIYCNNIVMKNNQNITYDPRVDRIVGFGATTLVRQSWQEVKP